MIYIYKVQNGRQKWVSFFLTTLYYRSGPAFITAVDLNLIYFASLDGIRVNWTNIQCLQYEPVSLTMANCNLFLFQKLMMICTGMKRNRQGLKVSTFYYNILFTGVKERFIINVSRLSPPRNWGRAKRWFPKILNLKTWKLGRLVLFSEGKDSQFILEGCHCGCRDNIFWELVAGINYSVGVEVPC